MKRTSSLTNRLKKRFSTDSLGLQRLALSIGADRWETHMENHS